jgi:hypothetical protein
MSITHLETEIKDSNKKHQFISDVLVELMVFLSIIKLNHIDARILGITYDRLSNYSIVRSFKLLDRINNDSMDVLIKSTNELLLKMDEYASTTYRDNRTILSIENDILSVKERINSRITDILKVTEGGNILLNKSQ